MIRARKMLGVVAAAAAVVGFCGAGASGQAASGALAPRLEPGSAWTYDLTLDALARQGEATTRVVQSARLELSVVETTADGGALVRGKVLRLVSMWSDGEGQVEFSWMRENDPDGSKATSPSPEYTAMMRSVIGATLEARLSKAGAVQEVSGLDKPLEASKEAARFGPAALGIFSPMQAAPALQPIWRADELVTTNGEQGAAWQTTRDVPLGPAGALRFSSDWVIAGVDNGVVRYTGEERVEVLRPAAPDPAAPSIELTAHAAKLSGAWNAADGVLQERTQERSLAAAYRLGDLTLTQDQIVKSSIRRAR